MAQTFKQGGRYLISGPRSTTRGKTTAAFNAAREAGLPFEYLSVLNSPTKNALLENLASIVAEKPETVIVIDLCGADKFERNSIVNALIGTIDENTIKLKSGFKQAIDKSTIFIETRDESELAPTLRARLQKFEI